MQVMQVRNGYNFEGGGGDAGITYITGGGGEGSDAGEGSHVGVPSVQGDAGIWCGEGEASDADRESEGDEGGVGGDKVSEMC